MGIMSFGTHRLWRAGEAELVSNLALLHLECAPPDEVGDGASGAAAVDGLLGGVVRVLHAGEGHVAEEAAAAGEATGGLAGLRGGETIELAYKGALLIAQMEKYKKEFFVFCSPIVVFCIRQRQSLNHKKKPSSPCTAWSCPRLCGRPCGWRRGSSRRRTGRSPRPSSSGSSSSSSCPRRTAAGSGTGARRKARRRCPPRRRRRTPSTRGGRTQSSARKKQRNCK